MAFIEVNCQPGYIDYNMGMIGMSGYLSCKSEEMLARTWEDVMKDMEQAYHRPTLARWRTPMKRASFQGLRKLQHFAKN